MKHNPKDAKALQKASKNEKGIAAAKWLVQKDGKNYADDGKHVKKTRVDHQKFIPVSHKEALKKVQDALEKGGKSLKKGALEKAERPLEKGVLEKRRKAFQKRYSPNLHFARSQLPNGEGRLPSYPLQPWCAQPLSGQRLAHHGLL